MSRETEMKKLLRKLIVLFGSVTLLMGCFCLAEGQYSRRVRVYRPGPYSNTRALMNRRAAMRKAAEKRRRAAQKRRQALHQKHM
jgi:hypothetical protein